MGKTYTELFSAMRPRPWLLLRVSLYGVAASEHCFMHFGMLEAIEIRMEIVSGNFRCLKHLKLRVPSPPLKGYGP